VQQTSFHQRAKLLVTGSLLALLPLALSLATPGVASAGTAGSCDATGQSYCCLCNTSPQGVSCATYNGAARWSCTSDYCDPTGCIIIK